MVQGAPAASVTVLFYSKERSRAAGAREARTHHIPPWYGQKNSNHSNYCIGTASPRSHGIEVPRASSAPNTSKPNASSMEATAKRRCPCQGYILANGVT